LGALTCTAVASVLVYTGGHGFAYHHLFEGTSPISTSSFTSFGSTMIVVPIAHGVIGSFDVFTPTDNKGNTYVQLGTEHGYENFPNSGTGVFYTTVPATGGSGHIVSSGL